MTQVDWHPYPKEKPKTHQYCFITIETLDKKKERFVETDFLVYFFGFHWARHKYWKIIAWAYVPYSYFHNHTNELPEPYKPELENE